MRSFSLTAKQLPLLLVLPLLLAAGLRLYRIDLPFIEPYNSISRQAIVAEVARNFYRNGYDFTRPEIDDNGTGNPLYNAEMPFYSYLMALLYAVVGGVREWAARSVSVVFSLLTIAMLMDLCRRLYGQAAACAAGVFLSVSPLYLALSRALQPESCMIFASVGCVYFFHLHLSGQRKWIVLYFAAACLFLAVATKIYNLYLLLPLAVMAFRAEGPRALGRGKYWALLIAALLPLLWYARMMHEGRTHDLIYDPYDFTRTRGPSGKSYLELFGSQYLLWAGKILTIHLLTPLGTLLAVLALRDKSDPPRPSAGPLVEWAVAVAIMLLIMWRTVLDHAYYLLPAVTILTLCVAKGARVIGVWVGQDRVRRLIAVSVLIAMLSAQTPVLSKLYRGIYFIPEDIVQIVHAGRLVDERADADDLVIASYGGSTALLYYTGRRGWAFDVRSADSAELIARLQEYHRQGARYFVTSRADQLRSAAGLDRYLRSQHDVVYDAGLILMVRLREVAVKSDKN